MPGPVFGTSLGVDVGVGAGDGEGEGDGDGDGAGEACAVCWEDLDCVGGGETGLLLLFDEELPEDDPLLVCVFGWPLGCLFWFACWEDCEEFGLCLLVGVLRSCSHNPTPAPAATIRIINTTKIAANRRVPVSAEAACEP